MNAAAIFLYILLDRGGSTQLHRTPHPSYSSCFAALDHIQIKTGDRTDEVAVAWCGQDGERYYGGTWWHDQRKDNN